MEESSRLYFARALAPPQTSDTELRDNLAPLNILQLLLRMHCILGLVFATFGPPYVETLLRILLGAKWANTAASSVLQAYCYCVPFLGLNGIVESFVQAVASPEQIEGMSWWMALWSIVYAAACWVFISILRAKQTGLIWANMVNMGCRIVWGLVFIAGWFKAATTSTHRLGFSAAAILPSRTIFVCFATCAFVVRASELYLKGHGSRGLLMHLAIGCISFGLCLIALYESFIVDQRSVWLT